MPIPTVQTFLTWRIPLPLPSERPEQVLDLSPLRLPTPRHHVVELANHPAIPRAFVGERQDEILEVTAWPL
jgi:hypothetical protein